MWPKIDGNIISTVLYVKRATSDVLFFFFLSLSFHKKFSFTSVFLKPPVKFVRGS